MVRSTVFITALGLLLGTSLVMSEGFIMPTKRHENRMGTTTTLRQRTPSTSLPSFGLVASAGTNSALASSGGGDQATDGLSREKTECPVTTPFALLGSLWGSMGVIYILAKAIKRVTPIALEPFGEAATLTLTPFQWSMYALNCLLFAYAEGYKGFQLKFSPLVVKRSFTLVIGTPQGNNPLNYLLAPLYSMGLFNATKKRTITSWSVTLGVALIVALVKRLPPVWRCIMDAGVVVGLSWGTLSILYFYIKSMIVGKTPDVDECLPAPKK